MTTTPEIIAAGRKALLSYGIDDLDDAEIATVYEAMHAAAPEGMPMGEADYRISKWLSLALEDPATDAAMKAEIEAWFQSRPVSPLISYYRLLGIV